RQSVLFLGDLKSRQTVSLLDMIRYGLVLLQNLAVVWHSIPNVVENMEDGIEDDTELNDDHKERVKIKLTKLAMHLDYLGLTQSNIYAEDLIDEELGKSGFKLARLRSEAEILQKRIDHELRGIITGFIPARHARYFENDQLFGPEVKASF